MALALLLPEYYIDFIMYMERKIRINATRLRANFLSNHIGIKVIREDIFVCV